jgi:ABC-type lipoprotein release transport system permease subunit
MPRLLAAALAVAALALPPSARALSKAEMVKLLATIDDRQRNSGDYKSLAYIEQKEKDQNDLVYEAVVYRRDADDKLMILFLQPKSEAGKGYLRIDKNLWMYDPTVGKWERRTEREKIGGTDSRRADFDESRLAEPGTIALFADQAKKLEVGVGDTVTLSAPNFRGTSNTADVVVVAVLRNVGVMSSWYLFTPASTVRGLYSLKEDNAGVLLLYLKDIARADETMAKLRAAYLEKGYRVMEHQGDPYYMKFETVAGEDWTGQKLDLTTWSDEVSFLRWIIQAFDSISLFLAAILMGIIGVGIVNAMWMAVRERTREIGTLRAIGMSRRRVLGLFLYEGLLLGFGATLLGALVGAGIGLGLDALHLELANEAARTILMSDTLHLRVSAAQVVGAVAILTVLTTLATFGPALRASRMRPITAIHDIG